MKSSRFGLKLAGVCLAAVPWLHAGVLYEQPVLNQTDRGPISEVGGQQIADQFVLSSAGVVGGVSWSGSYFGFDLSPGVTSINFVIRFFSDTGAPNVPAVDPFYSAGVSANVTDSGAIFDGRKIYTFSVDSLPTPVSIAGGSPTWISILESDASTPLGSFEWANSTVGSGDYDAFRVIESDVWMAISMADGAQPYRGNQAFALTDVPEPSTGLLLGVGAALFFQKRKRVR